MKQYASAWILNRVHWRILGGVDGQPAIAKLKHPDLEPKYSAIDVSLDKDHMGFWEVPSICQSRRVPASTA